MAGRFPPQQPPVQDAIHTSKPAISSAAKSSPFASGPVAMVNNFQHSFGASGQLQVPQQHLAASMASASSEPLISLFADKPLNQPDAAYDMLGQAAPPSAIDLFGQTVPLSSQQHRSRPDPFGSPTGSVPPFSMLQAHSDVQGEANLLLPADLFGPTSSPGQPSQENVYNNLFGNSEKVSTSVSATSQQSPISSSQGSSSSAFGWSQPPPRITQGYIPYQQQQLSLHPFGQAPPPAAPFLGCGKNTGPQLLRTSAPSVTTPELLTPSAQSIPCPATSTPSEVKVPLFSSSQITRGAPSVNELVDDFLKKPVDTRFAGFEDVASLSRKSRLADIPDTVKSLELLYARKRWRSLIKKSLLMLQSPSNDSNMTLEIKSWWLAGLIKEGHYENAASVLDQIGNLYEISVTDGATPFVPIRLFLLQAALSKCQGKAVNHEKQLFHLGMRLQSAIRKNETMSLLGVEVKVAARWLRIVQFALANHLVQQQKFMLALRICSQIDVQFLDDTEKVVVLSRVGRIHLQMGDLTAAKKLFGVARYHTNQVKTGISNDTVVPAEVVKALEARLLLNDGLCFFAQNELQEALRAFDSILDLQNTQVPTLANSDAELFLDEDIVCSAVNNYAICSLYCCDVKAAIAALERMVRSNPQRFLNGVVVFNLSSLYDLQFDNATSKSRKEMMNKIANLYDLEHVDPAAYRI
ncbi:unnamed protein product [Peronospora belbahrii]|uniref:Uncharacterized protein n=1 Tax=Peronospora belbahrii TaxID=622444 RepID=A0ABN8CZD9_9STRA|nr:unnamed protein product [Peronospora belbahrii]